MNNKKFNLCPVCLHDCSPFFPWGIDGKNPSYEICENCQVQWGYEDISEKAIEQYRLRNNLIKKEN
jgi:hypothetical protein